MKIKYESVKRKTENCILRQNVTEGVEYLTFPGLTATNLVNHLFTTRIGGVSKGIFASMNLSYTRGDEKEAVDENFRRIAAIFHSRTERMVCSDQTHTTNVRVVTEEDCGKGIIIEKDYKNVDGLITNEPGIILATFYADCVPLYFVDIRNKAIGLSHSGWRGTVEEMGACTINAMKEAYGSRPEDIKVAIGPSICRDCYEVSEDVAIKFKEHFSKDYDKILKCGNVEGKYQLDLWEANKIILINAGILPENIEVTDVCTCCNPEYFFSHRASQGKRGNLGAFMELRKS